MPHSVHPTPRSNTPAQQQHDIGGHWWNNNQPQSQWTEECPEFLVGQSAKNISILSRSADEERPRFTWEDVQQLASQYIPSFPLETTTLEPTTYLLTIRASLIS